MKPQLPRLERRRSQCPSCETARGDAVALKSADGLRTIRYRCAACGHDWNYTRLEPRPDRAARA